MARVCVYPKDCNDFSTNGYGVLTPTECTISETARGMYEVEIVHPIDKEGRWKYIVCGNIVKAMAPVRENPETDTYMSTVQTLDADESEADANDYTGNGDDTTKVTRTICKINNVSSGVARLYTKPSVSQSKIVAKVPNNKKVVLVKIDKQGFKKAMTESGAVGYFEDDDLEYVKNEVEEVTEPVQQISRRIIIPGQSRYQFFRIYKTETDTEHMEITAKAMHITYDLRTNPIAVKKDIEKGEAKATLDDLWNSLAEPHEFTLHDDYIEGEITADYTYKNGIEMLLDPDDGIASQANCRVFRDNFDIYVMPDAEQNHNVVIRRGKNLIGVTATLDDSNVVTKIIPVGTNDDKDVIGDPVISEHASDYATPHTKVNKYKAKVGDSGIKNVTKLKAKLKELAEEDFENGCDMPEYNLEVDFVAIQGTSYGSEYEALQAVYMYDTVTVIDSLIGLNTKVRVCEYEWDALSLRYKKIKLGDIGKVEQTVYSYNMPTGKISGSKLANNSTSGYAIRDLSLPYAKITNAAIDQLNANTIVAYQANIKNIAAGQISADEMVSAIAKITALYANTITADNILTDELGAQLAKIGVLTAGSATFDKESVRHLVANLLHVDDAVGGKVSISNLVADYASIVNAYVGNLCIKADNGNYYKLAIDSDGKITPQITTVTEDEKTEGELSTGQPIIETSMSVSDLYATDLKGRFALISRIDASRIDATTLVSTQVFADWLQTSNILANNGLSIKLGSMDAAISQNAEDTESATKDASEASNSAANAIVIANEAVSAASGLESQLTSTNTIVSEHTGAINKYERWMTFDEDGLTQGVPGSVYFTKVSDTGFYVLCKSEYESVAEMDAINGIKAKRITLGDIRSNRTSKGGWVWQIKED